jgi:hypothetical protein
LYIQPGEQNDENNSDRALSENNLRSKMMSLTEHPVVKRVQEKIKLAGDQARDARIILDAAWLRSVCFKHGADDAGFVQVDCPDLSDQKAEILAAFPRTRSLVSFVCRMNRDNVRSPAHCAPRGCRAGTAWRPSAQSGDGISDGNGSFSRQKCSCRFA